MPETRRPTSGDTSPTLTGIPERKNVYISDPASTIAVPLCQWKQDARLASIDAKTDTGTVTFNVEWRAKATPGTTGTELFASDITATSTNATTYGNGIVIPANAYGYFVASATASSPTELWLICEFVPA